MDQNRRLSLRSFRLAFFFMSGAHLVFAWAAWSQPLIPTVCICASIFSASVGFHAWWRMRKLAKKEQARKDEKNLVLIEPEAPDDIKDE